MESKLERKVRKLLGNDYHLCVTVDVNKGDGWKLFKYYENEKKYLSDINTPLMTSETNTDKELLKFAKEHHRISLPRVLVTTNLIIGIICLIILILNMFIFNNNIIRGIVLAIDIIVLFYNLLISKVTDHNCKADFLDFEDRMKQLRKTFEITDEE